MGRVGQKIVWDSMKLTNFSVLENDTYGTFPAWWSWQAALNSNILASRKAGGGNAYHMFSASVAFLLVRRINIEIKSINNK